MRAVIPVKPTKSLNTMATSSQAVGDDPLAAVQPVDDRLWQDVQEQLVRSRTLGLELAHHPVEHAGVRVADRLDLLEGHLELAHAADQPGVLAAKRVRRRARVCVRWVAHVPRSTVTNVSLRKLLVASPRIGPTSPAQ